MSPGCVTHYFKLKVTQAKDMSMCPGPLRGCESHECVLGRVIDYVIHYFEPHGCVPGYVDYTG